MMSTLNHRAVSHTTRSHTLFDWFTGSGFLMVDAGCFFAAVITLIPWNLYSEPENFWVADPLRKWAVIVVFHALLVGAWMLTRSLLFDTGTASTGSSLSMGWPRRELAGGSAQGSNASQSDQMPTASSVIAEQWAHRWLSDTDGAIAVTSAPPGNSAVPIGPPATFPPPETNSGKDSVEVAEGSGWSTWHEQEGIHTESASQSSADQESPDSPDNGSQRSSDHLHSAANINRRSPDQNDDSLVEEDLEWQWIEAAASAWLAKRDRDLPE